MKVQRLNNSLTVTQVVIDRANADFRVQVLHHHDVIFEETLLKKNWG
jgi:hypothetical protein